MILQNTATNLIEKDGKILLIKRGTPPQKGLWATPGGHVDPGETPEQAAQREANEEVGGVETEKKPFFVFVHDVPEGEERVGGVAHKHRCHAFRGRVIGEIMAGSDAAEFRWFTLEEAKKLKLTNYTERILKEVKG